MGDTILFSWLHLSDIHMLHGNMSHQSDQKMLLDELLSEVRERKFPDGSVIHKPDAVFVTGDIAYSGGEKNSDEYAIALECLKKISELLSLNTESIYTIPGNHDVQRSVYKNDEDVSAHVDLLRDGKRNIDDIWQKSKTKDHLLKRFKNYLDFSVSLNGRSTFFWHKVVKNDYHPIQILGLNSALLSQNDEDYQKLLIPLGPLADLENSSQNKNIISIALSHHPLSWLRPDSNAPMWLRAKAHVLLNGHMHRSELMQEVSPNGVFVTLQAGAVHKESSDNVNANSIKYGAIVLQESTKEVLVRVWTKMWSEERKKFLFDPTSSQDNSVFMQYKLPIDAVSKPTVKSDSFFYNLKIEREDSTYSKKRETDPPPLVDQWVGREQELALLERSKFRIVAITGMGGLGKSYLAANFLNYWQANNPSGIWDWRDCREQTEQFHTKLVAVIENITDGRIRGDSIERSTDDDLIKILLREVENKKLLLILDNVDRYVDAQSNFFTLGIKKLFDSILLHSTQAMLVLTCRPEIVYLNANFHVINLKGISEAECVELFKISGVDISSDTIPDIHNVHSLVQGHPLSLTLIAKQIAGTVQTFDAVIRTLQKGGDIGITKLMEGIWSDLKDRQKIVLRYMAELSRPEDKEWLCEYLNDELKSWNKFSKSFDHLIKRGLIVESTGGGRGEVKFYSLHPLVRNFVRGKETSPTERKSLINRVILVINRFITQANKGVTKNRLCDYNIFKTELALRMNDYKAAISTLLIADDELIRRCMPGELFRLGEAVFDQIEIDFEQYLDFHPFHQLCSSLSKAYVEYERENDARSLMKRYENMVNSQTAAYINFCDIYCYIEWFLGNYSRAISWGELATSSKTKANNIDTDFDASYNLALAQRDAGNYDQALSLFLNGLELDRVLKISEDEKKKMGHAFFGNIGRCVQFMDQNSDFALRLLLQSYIMVTLENSGYSMLNKGYACQWIAEELEAQKDVANAYLFYRQADLIWSHRAPSRVHHIKEKLAKLEAQITKNSSLGQLTETSVERQNRQWAIEKLGKS